MVVGGVVAVDEGNGTYVATLNLTIAGATALVITIDGVATPAPLGVTVVAAALDAARTTATLDAQLTTDLNGTLVLDPRDAFDNVAALAAHQIALAFTPPTCAYAFLSPTVATYACRAAGRVALATVPPIAGSPFALTVYPSAALNASATRLDGPRELVAQLDAAFTLTTYDYDDNQRDEPAADLAVACAPVACRADYAAAGQYRLVANLTAATAALHWAVTVQNRSIVGSPFTLRITPAAVAPAASTILAPAALNDSLTGRPVTLTLVLRDQFGNTLLSAASAPAISATLAPAAPVAVARHTNGTATLTFTLADSGQYTLQVRIGTAPVAGSPFVFVVQWAGLSNELVLAIGGAILLLVILIALAVWYRRSAELRRRNKYEIVA